MISNQASLSFPDNQLELEQCAESLCLDIEMKEQQQGGLVTGKRKSKPNQRFTSNAASAQAVARATGTRPQLKPEHKQKKKVLTEREKTVLAFNSMAKKRKEEEMFVGLLQRPSPSTSKQQASSVSRVLDLGTDSQLFCGDPSSPRVSEDSSDNHADSNDFDFEDMPADDATLETATTSDSEMGAEEECQYHEKILREYGQYLYPPTSFLAVLS